MNQTYLFKVKYSNLNFGHALIGEWDGNFVKRNVRAREVNSRSHRIWLRLTHTSVVPKKKKRRKFPEPGSVFNFEQTCQKMGRFIIVVVLPLMVLNTCGSPHRPLVWGKPPTVSDTKIDEKGRSTTLVLLSYWWLHRKWNPLPKHYLPKTVLLKCWSFAIYHDPDYKWGFKN